MTVSPGTPLAQLFAAAEQKSVASPLAVRGLE
jgi:hypothetical protein